MIRFPLRALGFVSLAFAFAALVVDGSRSIAGGHPLFYALGDSAAWLGGARYAAALGGIAGWPEPAQRAVAGLLAVPAALGTATLGLLLLYAGRPPAVALGFSGRRT